MYCTSCMEVYYVVRVNILMLLETSFDKIILKIKNIQRRYRLMNQYCKCCGHEMGYDYHVSDEAWMKLPAEYHNHVLCLHCFCKLYPDDLNNLEFEYYQI